MNTSGPSSRPRKPYPLALLNHLTVPFKRSTCAPSFRGSPNKPRFQRSPRKCVGIVLLLEEAVKDLHHNARGAWHGEARTFNSKARQEPLPLRALRYTKEELVG